MNNRAASLFNKQKPLEERIALGTRTQGELDRLICGAMRIKGAGRRVDYFSRQLLGAAYKESTLSGDKDTIEEFVINLDAMDCLTFIEYTEAMRLAKGFEEFKANLAKVRYRSGIVAFECRNHFFTDWKIYNAGHIADVTGIIGGQKSRKVRKILNEKKDGSSLIPGLQPCERELRYIPAVNLDYNLLSRLKTGDYAGIYTEIKGLDVSHTGIVIKDGADIIFRHASSSPEIRRVVDQDFPEYISSKPGLIVLRPK